MMLVKTLHLTAGWWRESDFGVGLCGEELDNLFPDLPQNKTPGHVSRKDAVKIRLVCRTDEPAELDGWIAADYHWRLPADCTLPSDKGNIVLHPKGEQPRWVPLTDGVNNILQRWLPAGDHSFYFRVEPLTQDAPSV